MANPNDTAVFQDRLLSDASRISAEATRRSVVRDGERMVDQTTYILQMMYVSWSTVLAYQ